VATTLSHSGLTVAYEAAGDPEFLFLHANGFCKETWQPVIDELGRPGSVSIDQPGHGGSDAPPKPYDWWDFGRSCLAVIDKLGMERPIGVGHSSGAAALAMAEILQPGTFERLVLIEPIIKPPPYRRRDDHPLVATTMRRRVAFGSYEEALDAYRGRGPFAQWEERAIVSYVQHGFELTADGWTLRCPPDVEAEVYATSELHGAWERLEEVTCPVDLVVGEFSDTHHAAFAAEQVSRFPVARLVTVAGATHFVPMEKPAELAGLISG